MNAQEYADYEKEVEEFLKKEGIENLTITGEEPSFSWCHCDCCRSSLGGDRYNATTWNPTTNEVQEYSICSDCVYYAEYGELDDQIMMEIEDSKKGGVK